MERSCDNCANLCPIGEGDHICEEKPVLVLEEYLPTDDYLWCNGDCWRNR